jgi:prepilin-type processing-associated H-X9-DG protein
MKNSRTSQRTSAFSVVELLVLILTLAVLFVIFQLSTQRSDQRAIRINCINNLKQVGLAVRIWTGDNRDLMPPQVSTNEGGSMEFVGTTNTFYHFRALSNELNTPKVAVCPEDKKRKAATDFLNDFDNSHLSYFFGVDANETNVTMLLSGDRHITNGMPLQNGMLTLTTNRLAGWTKANHGGNGNVALADGSVQQLSNVRLREVVATTGVTTNRLAFP